MEGNLIPYSSNTVHKICILLQLWEQLVQLRGQVQVAQVHEKLTHVGASQARENWVPLQQNWQIEWDLCWGITFCLSEIVAGLNLLPIRVCVSRETFWLAPIIAACMYVLKDSCLWWEPEMCWLLPPFKKMCRPKKLSIMKSKHCNFLCSMPFLHKFSVSTSCGW